MPTSQQEIEFGDLLKRNCQTINSICIRYCGGNAYYFDELRQECTMAIWAEFCLYGLDRFRGDSAESTWIHQIAYHAVINYFRNPNHQEFLSDNNRHSLELFNDSQLQPAPLQSQSLDDWNLLDDLTALLNNRERKLLDHYLDDDSYTTIARTEGITESTARKRMSRLIKKLKILIHK